MLAITVALYTKQCIIVKDSGDRYVQRTNQ